MHPDADPSRLADIGLAIAMTLVLAVVIAVDPAVRPRLLAAFAFALGFGLSRCCVTGGFRALFSSSPCWRSSRTIPRPPADRHGSSRDRRTVLSRRAPSHVLGDRRRRRAAHGRDGVPAHLHRLRRPPQGYTFVTELALAAAAIALGAAVRLTRDARERAAQIADSPPPKKRTPPRPGCRPSGCRSPATCTTRSGTRSRSRPCTRGLRPRRRMLQHPTPLSTRCARHPPRLCENSAARSRCCGPISSPNRSRCSGRLTRSGLRGRARGGFAGRSGAVRAVGCAVKIGGCCRLSDRAGVVDQCSPARGGEYGAGLGPPRRQDAVAPGRRRWRRIDREDTHRRRNPRHARARGTPRRHLLRAHPAPGGFIVTAQIPARAEGAA